MRKLDLAATLVPPPAYFGVPPEDADVSIVVFGTTKQPVRQAHRVAGAGRCARRAHAGRDVCGPSPPTRSPTFLDASKRHDGRRGQLHRPARGPHPPGVPARRSTSASPLRRSPVLARAGLREGHGGGALMPARRTSRPRTAPPGAPDAATSACGRRSSAPYEQLDLGLRGPGDRVGHRLPRQRRRLHALPGLPRPARPRPAGGQRAGARRTRNSQSSSRWATATATGSASVTSCTRAAATSR